MIQTMMGVFMLAAVSVQPVVPQEAHQGEVIVVRVPGEFTEVRGALGETQLGFYQTASGWVALLGFDLDTKPGAHEIAGVAVKGDQESRWKATVQVRDGDYPVQRITLQDDTHVSLSDANIARSRRESAQVREVFQIRSERAWQGNFRHPLDTAPEGGRFGARRIINDQPRNPHSGADYGVPTGTPVRASNYGRVVLADDHFFAGKSVFIDHGKGLVTMYFHLNEILVENGQEVKKGDLIGRVGSTGRSTGPHLHFGVRLAGARVDPASLMRQELE